MPGEYPRRLGASPLRAKALFIMSKYVMTRNILMNVVTEFDRNSRCRFKPSRCRALLYKDVAHTLSRESGTFFEFICSTRNVSSVVYNNSLCLNGVSGYSAVW